MISPPGSRPSRRAGTCRRNSTTRQGSQHMDGDGGTTSQSPDLDAKLRLTRTYRRLVRGTNINATSLLATDYLNHFNEVVMVLELVPDMPERSEEHTSELQSLMRISYAVFCLNKTTEYHMTASVYGCSV